MFSLPIRLPDDPPDYPDDIDAEAPPCTADCPCPLCRWADEQEERFGLAFPDDPADAPRPAA